jgi:hypothetical protein
MVARVLANSRRGRQLTAAKGTADVAALRRGLTPEQLEWNARVDARRSGAEHQSAGACTVSRVEVRSDDACAGMNQIVIAAAMARIRG